MWRRFRRFANISHSVGDGGVGEKDIRMLSLVDAVTRHVFEVGMILPNFPILRPQYPRTFSF